MRYWVDKPCNYDKIVLKGYKSYEKGILVFFCCVCIFRNVNMFTNSFGIGSVDCRSW